MPNSSIPYLKIIAISLAMMLVAAAFLTMWLTKPVMNMKNADAQSLVVKPSSPTHSSSKPYVSSKAEEASPQKNIEAKSIALAVPLSGCEAVIEAKDGKGEPTKLTGADGLFDRVMVEANAPLKVKFTLPNLTIGKDIIVSAPNGGKISRADGGELRFTAKANSQDLNLVFQPGISLGAYSVIVMHQGVSQTLDFWVGPQHPLGQPGPTLSSISTPASR